MADSEASLDQQPDLKKRARRRLVGAAAMALLAAIVLPMVMDHEPRPASQDIQVRIPAQDGTPGAAARILAAKPAATPLPPAAPTAETKPKPPQPAAEPAAEAVKPGTAAAAANAAEKSAEKVSEKPADKAADKPSDKATDKLATARSAEAPAEAKAGDAPAAGAGEQWVVQLGAYKEAGNVKLLLSKLKGMGVIAYTEKYDSPQGPRTRVRAGPFASKEAAEKARAKAKIIGVDGPVAPK